MYQGQEKEKRREVNLERAPSQWAGRGELGHGGASGGGCWERSCGQQRGRMPFPQSLFSLFFPFFSVQCVCACVCLCVRLRVPSIGHIPAAAPSVLCHQQSRGGWRMHDRGGGTSLVGRLCARHTLQSKGQCSPAGISQAPPAPAELKSQRWGTATKTDT